jgi:DNA-binding NarL/FixJ family response regulator
MIRIVVADDHPALRAGLQTVLESEPGIVLAGESAGDEESLWPMLHRAQPDLVLLDYHLPRSDGLQLCYRIKQEVLAPKVIVFSAYAGADLALPALLAKADAVVGKGVPARELFEAIRRVAAGERLLDHVSAIAVREAATRIPEADRALALMLLDGATEREVASTLRIEVRDVRHAVLRILSRLRLDVPTASGG